MEEIIQIIVKRLKKREGQNIKLTATDSKLSDSVFLENKYIMIENCDCFFLEKFSQKETNHQLVKSLFRSFDFGCKVQLYCSFTDTRLIPREVFRYDVEIFTANHQRCVTFVNRYITYQQIAVLPKKSLVLLTQKQRLTMLALEKSQEKKIRIEEWM